MEEPAKLEAERGNPEYLDMGNNGNIAPAIAATLFSSLVAILYCKTKDRGGHGRG